MAAVFEVRITAHFRRTLDEIEVFLLEAEGAEAFDALLDDLYESTIPNLERFPDMGRDFLTRAADSVEAVQSRDRLRTLVGSGSLREYIQPPYLLLYATAGRLVHLLAIRHHRQLSFDFAGLWDDV